MPLTPARYRSMNAVISARIPVTLDNQLTEHARGFRNKAELLSLLLTEAVLQPVNRSWLDRLAGSPRIVQLGPSVIIGCRVTPATAEALRRAAQADKQTLSVWVLLAITRYLKRFTTEYNECGKWENQTTWLQYYPARYRSRVKSLLGIC